MTKEKKQAESPEKRLLRAWEGSFRPGMILGVDPGWSSGNSKGIGVSAMTTEGDVWFSFTLDPGDGGAALHVALAEIVDLCAAGPGGGIASGMVAVIEDQHMGPNVLSLKRMVEIRTRCQVAVELRGCPVVLISPSTWQKLLKRPGEKGRLKRDQIKPRAKAMAAGLLATSSLKTQKAVDFGDWSGDSADATLMALWAQRVISPPAGESP